MDTFYARLIPKADHQGQTIKTLKPSNQRPPFLATLINMPNQNIPQNPCPSSTDVPLFPLKKITSTRSLLLFSMWVINQPLYFCSLLNKRSLCENRCLGIVCAGIWEAVPHCVCGSLHLVLGYSERVHIRSLELSVACASVTQPKTVFSGCCSGISTWAPSSNFEEMKTLRVLPRCFSLLLFVVI